jgi:hypothetical protein
MRIPFSPVPVLAVLHAPVFWSAWIAIFVNTGGEPSASDMILLASISAVVVVLDVLAQRGVSAHSIFVSLLVRLVLFWALAPAAWFVAEGLCPDLPYRFTSGVALHELWSPTAILICSLYNGSLFPLLLSFVACVLLHAYGYLRSRA